MSNLCFLGSVSGVIFDCKIIHLRKQGDICFIGTNLLHDQCVIIVNNPRQQQVFILKYCLLVPQQRGSLHLPRNTPVTHPLAKHLVAVEPTSFGKLG